MGLRGFLNFLYKRFSNHDKIERPNRVHLCGREYFTVPISANLSASEI